jgi:hypothetical protein
VSASPARVAILMPIFRDVSPVTLNSIMALVGALAGAGVSWSYSSVVGNSSLPLARAELLSRFLDDRLRPTHALFVDADSGFQPNVVLQMLACGVDVVAAPFARRNGQGGHNIGHAVPANPTIVKGAIEVESIGMGLMLISREVVAALIAAHPETECPRTDGGKLWALFPTTPPPGHSAGAFFGEDIGFCHLVRGIGRKVWALWNGPTIHTGTSDYRYCLADAHAAEARTPGETDLQALQRIGAMPNVIR